MSYGLNRLYNRKDLARVMPSGRVAEIGVFKGEYASVILKENNPKELVLVDSWLHYEYGDTTTAEPRNLPQATHDEIYESVVKALGSDPRVRIIRSFSDEASKMFPDEYFDWVYVDANHLLKYVHEDFENWGAKVKINGYLCGHDYTTSTAVSSEAQRLVDEGRYEMVYLTLDDGAESFALRRLK